MRLGKMDFKVGSFEGKEMRYGVSSLKNPTLSTQSMYLTPNDVIVLHFS